MITAFVGTIYEESKTPISGNGKTGSMVGVSLLDHLNKKKVIWSNYWTDFSEKICGAQEMIDCINAEDYPEHLILCLSEFGQILNSIGSKNNQVLFIETFASQLRKHHVDVYWDNQRFRSIHLRWRAFTDIIFIPVKYHFDGNQCNYNLCKKPHMVSLYSYKPNLRSNKPRITFDMTKVGKHYNTDEIILDKIILNKKEVD